MASLLQKAKGFLTGKDGDDKASSTAVMAKKDKGENSPETRKVVDSSTQPSNQSAVNQHKSDDNSSSTKVMAKKDMGEPSPKKRKQNDTEEQSSTQEKVHKSDEEPAALQCPDCSKTFKSALGLKYHTEKNICQKKQRDEPVTLECPDCSKTFKSAKGLKRHMEKKVCKKANRNRTCAQSKKEFDDKVCERQQEFSEMSSIPHVDGEEESSSRAAMTGEARAAGRKDLNESAQKQRQKEQNSSSQKKRKLNDDTQENDHSQNRNYSSINAGSSISPARDPVPALMPHEIARQKGEWPPKWSSQQKKMFDEIDQMRKEEHEKAQARKEAGKEAMIRAVARASNAASAQPMDHEARKKAAAAYALSSSCKSNDPRDRDQFHYLKKYGIPTGKARSDYNKRNAVMQDLLKYDDVHHDRKYEYRVSGKKIQLVKIPTKLGYDRPKKDNKPPADARVPKRGPDFMLVNRKKRFMPDLVEGLAESYCEGDEAEAANLMLYYFCKRHPIEYVKFNELAKEEAEKEEKQKKQRELLPPDFEFLDGTPDWSWNLRYMEMVNFQKEHGHCKVPTSMQTLKNWASSQRHNYNHKKAAMTEKRISLLNDIQFPWSLATSNVELHGPIGDPKFNLSVVAKLTWPQLSMRQCLILGGCEEDKLDEVIDEKHTWRTYYVKLKDRINRRLKDFEKKDGPAKAEVIRLFGVLDAEGAEAIFGETAELLPEYLHLANIEGNVDDAEMLRLMELRANATTEYFSDGKNVGKKKTP